MIAAPPLVVGQQVHIAPRAGRSVVSDRQRWVAAKVISVSATGCAVEDTAGRTRHFGRRRDELVPPGQPSTKLIADLPPANVAPSVSATLEALISAAHQNLSLLDDNRDFPFTPEHMEVLQRAVDVLRTTVHRSRGHDA